MDNDIRYPENLLYEDNAIGGITTFGRCKEIRFCNDAFYNYRRNPTSTCNGKNNYSFYDRIKTSDMYLENSRNVPCYAMFAEDVDGMYFRLKYVNTTLGSISNFTDYGNLGIVKNLVAQYKSDEIVKQMKERGQLKRIMATYMSLKSRMAFRTIVACPYSLFLFTSMFNLKDFIKRYFIRRTLSMV